MIRAFSSRRHFANRYARVIRDMPDRRRPIHAKPFSQERENVAALSALEAMVYASPGIDGKIGIFAAVKRARTAERAARLLERDRFADDPDDVGRFADALDFVVGNHSSTTVTPVPPSLKAPGRKPRTRVSLRSISLTRSRNAPVPFP